MEEALKQKKFYLNSKAAAASDFRLIPICAYAIACKISFAEFRKIFINFGAFIKIYKIRVMKKFSIIIFTLILGFSTAAAQTSDIQDTFFGVRFGTSQEAAGTILMRKGIIAISDYNRLGLYEVTLGGYEWRHVTMHFNDYGLYKVYLECNFNSRDNALSMFNRLFSNLTRIYGSYSSSDLSSLNDKAYMFMDDERMCALVFIYGESKGGDMFYYVTLDYCDMNLYNKTVDEL